LLIISLSSRVYNVILSFNVLKGKWIIDAFNLLPEQLHPQISVEELIECEVVVKNDPIIQALAKDVGAFTNFTSEIRRYSFLIQEFYLSKYFVMAGQ
jgi:hypothetical protein